MKKEKLDGISRLINNCAVFLELLAVDIDLGFLELNLCTAETFNEPMGPSLTSPQEISRWLASQLTEAMAEIDRVTGECAVQVQVHQELAQKAKAGQLAAELEADRLKKKLKDLRKLDSERAVNMSIMRNEIHRLSDLIDDMEYLRVAGRIIQRASLEEDLCVEGVRRLVDAVDRQAELDAE